MITIVTGNSSKFAQMSEALSRHDIAVERADIDIDEIQENDQKRIVIDKCKKAATAVGGPVLVDDTGFYFERYPSFPGMSAKFMYKALGFPGLSKLIESGDTARFRCSVAYAAGPDTEPQLFWGEYAGTLTPPPESNSLEEEMPYALFFQPEGSEIVLAEMTDAERENDHRHQALNAFAHWYDSVEKRTVNS
jgi:non-canonical purine NTP pyrophosphatase (RdgB/HAM1 family)